MTDFSALADALPESNKKYYNLNHIHKYLSDYGVKLADLGKIFPLSKFSRTTYGFLISVLFNKFSKGMLEKHPITALREILRDSSNEERMEFAELSFSPKFIESCSIFNIQCESTLLFKWNFDYIGTTFLNIDSDSPGSIYVGETLSRFLELYDISYNELDTRRFSMLILFSKNMDAIINSTFSHDFDNEEYKADYDCLIDQIRHEVVETVISMYEFNKGKGGLRTDLHNESKKLNSPEDFYSYIEEQKYSLKTYEDRLIGVVEVLARFDCGCPLNLYNIGEDRRIEIDLKIYIENTRPELTLNFGSSDYVLKIGDIKFKTTDPQEIIDKILQAQKESEVHNKYPTESEVIRDFVIKYVEDKFDLHLRYGGSIVRALRDDKGLFMKIKLAEFQESREDSIGITLQYGMQSEKGDFSKDDKTGTIYIPFRNNRFGGIDSCFDEDFYKALVKAQCELFNITYVSSLYESTYQRASELYKELLDSGLTEEESRESTINYLKFGNHIYISPTKREIMVYRILNKEKN